MAVQQSEQFDIKDDSTSWLAGSQVSTKIKVYRYIILPPAKPTQLNESVVAAACIESSNTGTAVLFSENTSSLQRLRRKGVALNHKQPSSTNHTG